MGKLIFILLSIKLTTVKDSLTTNIMLIFRHNMSINFQEDNLNATKFYKTRFSFPASLFQFKRIFTGYSSRLNKQLLQTTCFKKLTILPISFITTPFKQALLFTKEKSMSFTLLELMATHSFTATKAI